MNTKPSVLIVYDYFYPGYRAGGPIQSLANLAVALNENYRVYVITSSHDFTSRESYKGIAVNQWNEVNLPGSRNVTYAYYTDKRPDKKIYQQFFNEIKPDVIYLNNIYSYLFFRLPLLALKRITGNHKIVICPRGMLQQGALAVKPFKKKYISLTYALKVYSIMLTGMRQMQKNGMM